MSDQMSRTPGSFDVLELSSTRDTFSVTLGECTPDEPDTETKLAELLRIHGAFSSELLAALVELVKAERQAENEAAMDERDDDRASYDW